MNGGWGSFGGSYGKSAYMLVYERRKKKPIKILVSPEEHKEDPEGVFFDEKKEEYYRLSDYKTGVEEIFPSSIYQKVQEDNKKFEFDNDIYSSEFFEFVRSILVASSTHAALRRDDRHHALGHLAVPLVLAGVLRRGQLRLPDERAARLHRPDGPRARRQPRQVRRQGARRG